MSLAPYQLHPSSLPIFGEYCSSGTEHGYTCTSSTGTERGYTRTSSTGTEHGYSCTSGTVVVLSMGIRVPAGAVQGASGERRLPRRLRP
eukprot:1344652-Rhodomonas_salina.1